MPGSMEGAGGGCTITNNKGGQDPQGPPCFSNSKKNITDSSTDFFNAQKNKDVIYFHSVNATPIPACSAGHCTCVNTDTCKGNIKITANVTPAASQEFSFDASGLGVAPFHIITTGGGYGEQLFPNLITVYPDPWTFEALLAENFWTVIPGDGNHKYDVDSIDCASQLNRPAIIDPLTGIVTEPAYIVSTWEVDSTSVKTKAKVTQLGNGDTVTCNYHIHKTSK